jgi:hypothetical protein
MRIPMRGRVGSLNAAVAGSILLVEALEQREASGATGAPPGDSPASARVATEEPPETVAEGQESTTVGSADAAPPRRPRTRRA